MVQRPPFDRNSPPPGGFDPRFDDGPRREWEREPSRDPFDRGGPLPPARRGLGSNRLLLILGGLLLLGAIVFGLTLTRSGPGGDRLGEDGKTAASDDAESGPEARCAAPATYDRIKRELFRQAAVTRGGDAQAFDQLAAYASLRVSNPVLREQDEGLERVSCSADAALDLPPGVQVVGGRRSLTASLGYNLQPAADGSGDVVSLTGAEAITVPLATLARVGSAQSAPQPEPVPIPGPPPTAGDEPVEPAPPPPAPPAPTPEPATASAKPSFNCANARTRGEIAVCRNENLAALDRQMAGFYVSAMRDADGEQRALLQRTRDRFLAFRDRCTSDRCVADAYRGRISEIRDIVDGRWRPQ